MNIKINISALFTAALLALSFAGCDNNKRIIPESQTDTINSPAADKGTLSSQPESTVQNPKAQSRTSAQPSNTDTSTNTDTETDTTSLQPEATDLEPAAPEDTDLTETDSEEKASPMPIELGGYTVTAEQVTLDNSYKPTSQDSLTAEMTGGTLYILDGGKLISYGISGTTGTFEQEMTLARGYTKMSTNNYGTIYISGDNKNAVYISDGGMLTDTELRGNLELSELQDIGLIYSKSSDNVLVYQNGDTKNWAITNMKDNDTRTGEFNKINNIEIAADRVFVTGSSAEDNNNRKVAVYTTDGELISVTNDKTSGNGMTSITPTAYGYMVTSPGMISLYDFEYNLTAQTTAKQLQELFGNDNDITVNSLFSLNDNTMLAVCVTDDEQLCLYKISVQ